MSCYVEGRSTCRDAFATWPRSVAVFGAAGLVGSGIVRQLRLNGCGRTFALHDPRRNVLRAHVIDIEEACSLAGAPAASLTVAEHPGDVPASDLVVVAASAPEGPETDRRRFLDANLGVLRDLAPHVARSAGQRGLVLMQSNPVDVLADALRRLAGVDPGRVIGYSLNDSVRFRVAVARELDIEPTRVEAWVLGEHGAGQVPLFSRVLVDGEPVVLGRAQRERVRADVGGWFARWARLRPNRSSGWTTPIGTVEVLRAAVTGGVVPASVWTGGRAGLAATYVTLPARLGPSGLVEVVDWALAAGEWAALQAAAEAVRRTVGHALGAGP